MEALALSAVIIIATVFSVLVFPRLTSPDRPGRGWARHPGTWLLVMTALVFLNQVLFTVYVQREWHGDVSRIARFLPDGWFDMADLVARGFPEARLLAAATGFLFTGGGVCALADHWQARLDRAPSSRWGTACPWPARRPSRQGRARESPSH